MAHRKPASKKTNKTLTRPVRDFNINCNLPRPLQSSNLSSYEVNELSKPIQCSDRISFEVGRVLFNLYFKKQRLQ